MINKNTFVKEIGKVLLLCGQSVNKMQIEAFYDEIKDRYEDEDLIKACKDRRLYKEWAYKVHIAILLDILDEILSDRVEEEAKRIKKENQKKIEELIKSENLPDEIRNFLQKL